MEDQETGTTAAQTVTMAFQTALEDLKGLRKDVSRRVRPAGGYLYIGLGFLLVAIVLRIGLLSEASELLVTQPFNELAADLRALSQDVSSIEENVASNQCPVLTGDVALADGSGGRDMIAALCKDLDGYLHQIADMSRALGVVEQEVLDLERGVMRYQVDSDGHDNVLFFCLMGMAIFFLVASWVSWIVFEIRYHDHVWDQMEKALSDTASE